MSPLFTYNKKLLVENKALSTTDDCCCVTCQDPIIDNFTDGTNPTTTFNTWNQGIDAPVVDWPSGLPLNGVIRGSRELAKTEGGSVLWSGIGTGAITLKTTLSGTQTTAWVLRYDGRATGSDSNFFIPPYVASTKCYDYIKFTGMSSPFNGRRLITTLVTRRSNVNNTYTYTIDPITLNGDTLLVPLSNFTGAVMPPKFKYLVIIQFRFENMNNTAVPRALGTSYTIGSIKFTKEP
jgi:hypothetical protein